MSSQFLRDIRDLDAKITVLADMLKLHLEGFRLLRESMEALEKRVVALESPKPAKPDAKPPKPRRSN